MLARRPTLPPRRPSTACRSRSRISTRRPGSARRSPAAVRGERPRLRPRARRPDARGRLRRPRQDEYARVRHDRLHRLAAERAVPDAVGPRQERGWVERRRGGGRRGRARSDRAGLRRRRLDPDPGLVLRALRDQGIPWPGLECPVRARHRARHRRRRSRGRRSTPRHTWTSSPATSGATRSRPRRPSGRTWRRSASIRAGCGSRFTTEAPIDTQVDPACVAAARDAAELLASLGHDVEEAAPGLGRRRS